MSDDKMRAEFEKIYSVPPMTRWSVWHEEYVPALESMIDEARAYTNMFYAFCAGQKAAQRQGEDVPASSIDPNTIRVSAYSSDRGSPWVPQMARGVQIIHIPTGIEVVCDSEKSQHLNKHKALAELEDRISCITAQRQGGEAVTYWVLYDSESPRKYIKKAPDGCLAFFDNESDAKRMKRRHKGVNYKMVTYYTNPQPQPAVPEGLLKLAEFGRQIFNGFSDGGAPDLWDMQDMAEDIGLMEPEQRNEPCADSDPDQCRCLEYGVDFPTTCYRVPDKYMPLLWEQLTRPEPPTS